MVVGAAALLRLVRAVRTESHHSTEVSIGQVARVRVEGKAAPAKASAKEGATSTTKRSPLGYQGGDLWESMLKGRYREAATPKRGLKDRG